MKIISTIQQLPINTRTRILWGVTAIVAVLLLALWLYSTTRQVQTIDPKQLNPLSSGETAGIQSINTESKYISVEWIEHEDKLLKVYFTVNNSTKNILNFSNRDYLGLTAKGTTYKASSIQDRQGNNFVVKVLSDTQLFGVATFPDTDAEQAKIKFDGLFFESLDQVIFSETFDLDLVKLEKEVEIR